MNNLQTSYHSYTRYDPETPHKYPEAIKHLVDKTALDPQKFSIADAREVYTFLTEYKECKDLFKDANEGQYTNRSLSVILGVDILESQLEKFTSPEHVAALKNWIEDRNRTKPFRRKGEHFLELTTSNNDKFILQGPHLNFLWWNNGHSGKVLERHWTELRNGRKTTRQQFLETHLPALLNTSSPHQGTESIPKITSRPLDSTKPNVFDQPQDNSNLFALTEKASSNIGAETYNTPERVNDTQITTLLRPSENNKRPPIGISSRDSGTILGEQINFKKSKKPTEATPRNTTAFEKCTMLDKLPASEDPEIHEIKLAGATLYSAAPSNIRSATDDIYLIQTRNIASTSFSIPKTGTVVLAVTWSEYVAHQNEFANLLDHNKRLHLLVSNNDTRQTSNFESTLALMQWALSESETKRFHVLGDQVLELHGELFPHTPGANRITAISLENAIATPGTTHPYTIWDFPNKEAALAALSSTQSALSLLPGNFPKRYEFMLHCMHEGGTFYAAHDHKSLSWSNDNSQRGAVNVKSHPTDKLEKTYLDRNKCDEVIKSITTSKYPEPEQIRLKQMFESIFKKIQKNFDKASNGQLGRIDALKNKTTPRVSKDLIYEKINTSQLRQELLTEVKRFSQSDRRVMTVTAPCGVGKSLILAACSIDRQNDEVIWYSLPTNVLAKEFSENLPVENLQVHSKGEIGANSYNAAVANNIDTKVAVFVHITLLNVLKQLAETTPNELKKAVVFIDEWHNLSKDQLKDLQAVVQKTNVKLVLMSATPRAEHSKLELIDNSVTHFITTERALSEGLLRPRLFFDGTTTSREWHQYIKNFVDTYDRETPSSLPQENALNFSSTDFETRYSQAMNTLDCKIQGKALWTYSGLVFVNSISEAKTLCTTLFNKYPGLTVYNLTGDVDMDIDFSKERPFLAVCCQRLKEGSNIHNLGYVMSIGTPNEADAIQIAGRLSRPSNELEYGLYFAFGDFSHSVKAMHSDKVDKTKFTKFIDECKLPSGENITKQYPLIPARENLMTVQTGGSAAIEGQDSPFQKSGTVRKSIKTMGKKSVNVRNNEPIAIKNQILGRDNQPSARKIEGSAEPFQFKISIDMELLEYGVGTGYNEPAPETESEIDQDILGTIGAHDANIDIGIDVKATDKPSVPEVMQAYMPVSKHTPIPEIYNMYGSRKTPRPGTSSASVLPDDVDIDKAQKKR